MTHFTKIYTNGFKYMKRTKSQKNSRKKMRKMSCPTKPIKRDNNYMEELDRNSGVQKYK